MKNNQLYIAGLVIAFIISAGYTYTEKLDFNGDNCMYFIYAKSIMAGKGYVNLQQPGEPAGNAFPPGYPILMIPFSLISENYVLQNLAGEFYLLGAAILSFLILLRINVSRNIAFFISLLIITNEYLLKYATMMMSELPYVFFCIITLLFLLKDNKELPFYRSRYFWLAIISATFAYHIRNQGLTLVAAVAAYYLFTKKWWHSFFAVITFGALCLPWILRNKMIGLAPSKYYSHLFMANSWSPEKGTLSVGQLCIASLKYFIKLLDTAITETILCFGNMGDKTTGFLIPGIIITAIVFYGAFRVPKIHAFLFPFLAANFAIISVFGVNSPVWNRHMVCFLPFLLIAFYYGLTDLFSRYIYKKKIPQMASFAIILIATGIQFSFLQPLHDRNKAEYGAEENDFISACEFINNNCSDTAIYCSRKPEVFYLLTEKKSVTYAFSTNPSQVVKDMVNNKVDMVLVDRLPYSSNAKYLFPTIMKYKELYYPLFMTPEEPKTYVARFYRENASKLHL